MTATVYPTTGSGATVEPMSALQTCCVCESILVYADRAAFVLAQPYCPCCEVFR